MFHLQNATAATVRDVPVSNVTRNTTLYTDASRLYTVIGTEFSTHGAVKHSAKEYARRKGEVVVHTNTTERVFSVFNRSMVGVYQHCGEAHPHHHIADSDFRYNLRTALKVTDAEDAIRGAAGKRLTYQQTDEGYYA